MCAMIRKAIDKGMPREKLDSKELEIMLKVVAGGADVKVLTRLYEQFREVKLDPAGRPSSSRYHSSSTAPNLRQCSTTWAAPHSPSPS